MDEPDDWEPSDCVYERYALWVSVTTLVTVLLDAVSIGAECDLSSGAWDILVLMFIFRVSTLSSSTEMD